MKVKYESTELNPRHALQVSRYHTWPRIRDQSIGEHSMQVMRILLAIWPECPRHMLVYCLRHDLGEKVTGDLPYPVKVNNPDLKVACDRVERDAVDIMSDVWMIPSVQNLSQFEKDVFKLAEYVEMWEWGKFETSMGNTLAQPVVWRCADKFRNILSEFKEQSNDCLMASIAERAAKYIDRSCAQ